MSADSISCSIEEAAEACRTTPSKIRLLLLREEIYETAVEGTGPDAVITSPEALRCIIDHYEEEKQGLLRDQSGLEDLKAQLPDGGASPRHEAHRMSLVGVGRARKNAIARETPSGYAYVSGPETEDDCHLWISDLPDVFEGLLEVDGEQADWLPPVVPKLQFAPEKTDKGWRAENLTVTSKHWSRALVQVQSDGTVGVPGVEQKCYLWADDPDSGYYIAAVWPGMPTDVDTPSEWNDAVVVRPREPFRWEADAIDNADSLRDTPSITDPLVSSTASRIVEALEEDEDEAPKILKQALDHLRTHGSVLLQGINQKIAAELVEQGAPPAPVARMLLAEGNVEDETATTLFRRAARTLFDDSAVQGFDLETDGREIWQIGIAPRPDSVETYRRSRIDEGLDQIRAADEHPWVGHNVKNWDQEVLRRNDAAVSEERLWDTLRMEALLSPRRPSLALDTTHEAGDDAAAAYRLFRTQVVRLLIREHRGAPLDADGLLRPLDSASETAEVIRRLVEAADPYHDVLWDAYTSAAEELLASASLPPVVERLQEELDSHPLTDAVHVLYPSSLRSLIERLEGVQVMAGEDSPHSKHIRAPEAVDDEEADAYTARLAAVYRHDCAQRSEAPTIGGLSPWVQSHFRDHPKWMGPPDPDEMGSQTQHRAVPLGAYAPDEQGPPEHVIVLAPKLAAATSQRLLSTYKKDELKSFIAEHHLWAQFDGAGSYCQLTDDQVDALDLEASSNGKEGRFWLERTPQGRYAVHHYEEDKLNTIQEAIPEACTWVELEPEETSAPILCEMPDTSDVKLTADQQRLYPSTRQRARYWTVQALLLREVAADIDDEPIVLLTQGTDDLEALRSFFRRQDPWRVPEGGTLRRRLELVADAPAGQGLVILPLSRWPALLAQNVSTNVHLVVESLPIKKHQATRQAEVVSAALNDGETEEATEVQPQSREIYAEGEGSVEQGEEDILAHRPYSLQRGLHLVAPVLEALAHASSTLAEDASLRVLDPRVAPIDLPVPIDLEAHRVPAYEAEVYEGTLEKAESYFASPSHAEDLELPDGWRDTLAHVFLPDKDDGSTYRFRDPQKEYLEPIMQRDSDVLVEMPTGSGKSVLFQAPALYHGLQHGLLSIVVTPLKALMVDQVRSLHEKGFLSSVEFINSDLPRVEIRDIYRRIASGSVSLVYIAPERFRSRSFVRAVESRLRDDGTLCYFVFDEVHTVSLWGLDFRPDFLRAKDFVNQKRQDPEASSFPCVMLSATITEQIYEHLDDIFHDYSAQPA